MVESPFIQSLVFSRFFLDTLSKCRVPDDDYRIIDSGEKEREFCLLKYEMYSFIAAHQLCVNVCFVSLIALDCQSLIRI